MSVLISGINYFERSIKLGKNAVSIALEFTRSTRYSVFKKSVPNSIIEGIPVEVVKHAKLLGVILSDDLTWNMHVDSIVNKAAKRICCIS